MSEWFLEQQINTKFCETLGKKRRLYNGPWGLWVKIQVFLTGINDSKRTHMSKLQMKTMLSHHFF
jgi:hypothetical protein